MRSLGSLVFFVVLCLGAAYVGSLFTRPSIPGWYASLDKPSWTPPNWVFAPVWTTLYLMMAFAAWWIWKGFGWPRASVALSLFGVQLALNVMWSALFFGWHRPGLAFAEIVILWVLIAATAVSFWRLSPLSGALLLPYLAWVSYAAALNFAIWRMNA